MTHANVLAAFIVPLGFDTFAVAVALGLRGMRPWIPALVFAAFEGAMPLVGMMLGRFAGTAFDRAAVITGGAILVALGVHALREAFEEEDETERMRFDSLRAAMLAGVAVSIDEIAAGISLGTLGFSIPLTVGLIALQAFVVTLAGISLGARIGARSGAGASRGAHIVAGIAFALLGVWVILERLRA